MFDATFIETSINDDHVGIKTGPTALNNEIYWHIFGRMGHWNRNYQTYQMMYTVIEAMDDVVVKAEGVVEKEGW